MHLLPTPAWVAQQADNEESQAAVIEAVAPLLAELNIASPSSSPSNLHRRLVLKLADILSSSNADALEATLNLLHELAISARQVHLFPNCARPTHVSACVWCRLSIAPWK